MSKGGAGTTAAVALAAGAALLAAWFFKEDIESAFESETATLLKRVDLALTNVERGMAELEASDRSKIGAGGLRKMLTSCSLDLDNIFHFLDEVKIEGQESKSLRTKRKGLVDRANSLSERHEVLQRELSAM